MISNNKGNQKILLWVLVFIVIMSVLGWLKYITGRRKKIKDRQAVVSTAPIHPKYMTLDDRMSIKDRIQTTAFPHPDDSVINIKLGNNEGYKILNRIGSRSKYASSFVAETLGPDPCKFAMRVYAVPSHDRSGIEREGLTLAQHLLQQGCCGSMPVVYRCYRTEGCKLATPFDGPNTGVCHIIVNELANMDAEQWMQGNPSLEQVKAVCFQVLHGLHCMLQCGGKRHGDLKASNVLIFLEPKAVDGEYVHYRIAGEDGNMKELYVPWTGVRATLWDFEFLKKVDTRQNVAGETLDCEKFLRELIHFYTFQNKKSVSKSRAQDDIGRHLSWMKDTVHRNYKKPLLYFLETFSKEYETVPSGDYTILETFKCPQFISQ